MAITNNRMICRTVFAATLLTAPFQIFTSAIGQVYPSLTLLFALMLFLFYDVSKVLKTSLTMKTWAALVLVQIISLLWAVDIREGIREIVYSFSFFLVFGASMQESKRNLRSLTLLIIAYSVLTLSQSTLVIYFRLIPDVKIQYLQGHLAEIFTSPNTLIDLFGSERNNVLDEAKSGGFEVNANTGAAWVGMVGMVTMGLAIGLRRKLLFFVSLFHLVAVFFSGSKAASLLVCCLLALMYLTVYISKKFTPSRFAILISFVVLLTVAGSIVVAAGSATDFGQASSDTLDTRKLIWAHAAVEFLKHPILGQGFGGWSETFQAYAWRQKISDGYPPHDTLIRLWSQSGLIAALVGAAFMIAFSVEVLTLVRSGSRTAAWIGAGIWCGFLFVSIQGLGENWGLLGTLRMSPFIAACFALSRALGYYTSPATRSSVLNTSVRQIKYV
ncbi:O-antigen ligase family protein [Paraburkholderia sediminicola]|uniref:O-antigen ligase family protein n=1 Tax=Paraburkholderia sediminicola TaxID=458836 RepID=UPI0038BBCF65